jgi:hypothetical protein
MRLLLIFAACFVTLALCQNQIERESRDRFLRDSENVRRNGTERNRQRNAQPINRFGLSSDIGPQGSFSPSGSIPDLQQHAPIGGTNTPLTAAHDTNAPSAPPPVVLSLASAAQATQTSTTLVLYTPATSKDAKASATGSGKAFNPMYIIAITAGGLAIFCTVAGILFFRRRQAHRRTVTAEGLTRDDVDPEVAAQTSIVSKPQHDPTAISMFQERNENRSSVIIEDITTPEVARKTSIASVASAATNL